MHVVITGASSGIGLAIAKAFDVPGNRLSLVARRKVELAQLRAQLRCESQAIVADLSNAEEPIGWLVRAETTFGPADVLINNAGTSYVEPSAQVDTERVRRIFQINVHTPIAAIHHVLPAMLARKSGCIVNVASNAAFQPAPYFSHYTATKGALGNFSESLRMEVSRDGVHVATIYPGPVKTPMADRNFAQVKESSSTRFAPVGDADVLAKLVLRAVRRKQARVIYPSLYAIGWYLPGIGRFIAEHFVPKAKGTITPPLDGDSR